MSMRSLWSLFGRTKKIAVMDATGDIGNSVINAFQKLTESGDETFQIRAIINDSTTSEEAKEIEPLVEEVMIVDENDEKSMTAAFNGCHGIFIVTDYWENMDVFKEMKILRICKNAAKNANVSHIVLSTSEDTRKFVSTAENKYTWKVTNEDLGMYVVHFDGKGEIDKEFDELPTTKLYTSFSYENFLNDGIGPTRNSEYEKYSINLPMAEKKMAMNAVSDIGKCICAILLDESYIGKSIGIRSDALTGKEIADAFTKVCEQPVEYNNVPIDMFASFDFPSAGDLANMFRYYDENNENFLKLRELGDLDEKIGGVTKFEEWLKAHKGHFDLKPVLPPPEPPAIEEEEDLFDHEDKTEQCKCVIS